MNRNNTHPNTTDKNLTQKDKMNEEIIKKIKTKKKTTLPSLKNCEWKTVKLETEKINKLLTDISTNKITKLNELIYAGAKLVCDKIGVPLKNTNRNSKPGWEIRLKTQIRNSRQTKMLRRKKSRKYVGMKREKPNSEQNKLYNSRRQMRKYWRKKRDLKDTKTGSNNTDKTGHSKTTKENSTGNSVKNARRYTNNWMQRKQNNFAVRYGNGKNIIENRIDKKTWKKNFKDSKKTLKQKYAPIHLEQHPQKYQIGKRPPMIVYKDSV